MSPDSTDPNEANGSVDDIDDSRMTLGEHLAELRVRLIRATLAFVVAFLAIYTYRLPAWEFMSSAYAKAAVELNVLVESAYLERLHVEEDLAWEDLFYPPAIELPASDADFDVEAFRDEHRAQLRVVKSERFPDRMQVLAPSGMFVAKIKVAFLLSLFIAGPVFLWEMWMFIAAGLYKAEKKVVYSFFPITLVLFLTGVAFGFYYLVPNAIYFLQADGFGSGDASRHMSISHYMKFLQGLSLAMGIVFQLPVAQVLLSKTGVVAPKLYAQYRGHMAITALVVAAIVTPPDPFTQILLAGPAIVLWEVGYWISRLVWTEPVAIIPADELDENGLAL